MKQRYNMYTYLSNINSVVAQWVLSVDIMPNNEIPGNDCWPNAHVEVGEPTYTVLPDNAGGSYEQDYDCTQGGD
jgi:hypothetical protein